MLRMLLYLGFILLGAMVAPILLQHKGFVLISFGSYSIKTTALALALFVLALFGFLQVCLWCWRTIKFLLSDQLSLSHLWQKQNVDSFTIQGQLALMNQNWEDAENLMSKYAKHSKLPTLNYLSAAHAAHLQQKIKERDQYLIYAAKEQPTPLAVQLAQANYLVEDNVEEARKRVDRFQITPQSSQLKLHMAWLTYQAQGDYQAIKPLLKTFKKNNIISKARYDAVQLKTTAIEITQAKSQAEVTELWDSLSIFDHQKPVLQASYGLALNVFDTEAAKKFILRSLKKPEQELLNCIEKIFNWETDKKIQTQLNRMLKKNPDDHALVQCIARLCIQSRLFQKAKTYLTQTATTDRNSLLLLAHVCEYLGETKLAIEHYKQVAAMPGPFRYRQHQPDAIKTHPA
jgi:HemY protein